MRPPNPFQRQTRDLPVPKHDASLRARGLRSRGALTSLATNGSLGVAFRQSWMAPTLPRRSFRDPISGPQVPLSTLRLGLTVSPHDSGTRRFATPFSSGTLTLLRHAGFYRRTRTDPLVPLSRGQPCVPVLMTRSLPNAHGSSVGGPTSSRKSLLAWASSHRRCSSVLG